MPFYMYKQAVILFFYIQITHSCIRKFLRVGTKPIINHYTIRPILPDMPGFFSIISPIKKPRNGAQLPYKNITGSIVLENLL